MQNYRDNENREDWGDFRNHNRRNEAHQNNIRPHRYGAGSYENELYRDYSESGVFGRRHAQDQNPDERERNQREDRFRDGESYGNNANRSGNMSRNYEQGGRFSDDHNVYHSSFNANADREQFEEERRWDDLEHRSGRHQRGNSPIYSSSTGVGRNQLPDRGQRRDLDQQMHGYGVSDKGDYSDRNRIGENTAPGSGNRNYYRDYSDSGNNRHEQGRSREENSRLYGSSYWSRHSDDSNYRASARNSEGDYNRPQEHGHSSFRHNRFDQDDQLSYRSEGADTGRSNHPRPGNWGASYNDGMRNQNEDLNRNPFREEMSGYEDNRGYRREQEGQHEHDQGFIERTVDRVRTWFGGNEHKHNDR